MRDEEVYQVEGSDGGVRRSASYRVATSALGQKLMSRNISERTAPPTDNASHQARPKVGIGEHLAARQGLTERRQKSTSW